MRNVSIPETRLLSDHSLDVGPFGGVEWQQPTADLCMSRAPTVVTNEQSEYCEEKNQMRIPWPKLQDYQLRDLCSQ